MNQGRRGGGVMLFLKKNIRLVSIDFSDKLEIIECVIELICMTKVKILTCYRPELNNEGFTLGT